MTQRSLAEIHARLNEADTAGLPGLRVVVLRNVTVEPIEPHWRLEALEAGFAARPAFGRYDAILQDAGEPGSPLWAEPPDAVVVVCALDVLSPPLARRFPSLDAAALDAELARVDAFVAAVLAALAARGARLVLWHGFETPLHPALGVLDAQADDGQTAAVARANARLRERLRDAPGAYFVDADRHLARLGAERFYDRRYWHVGRAPYSQEALASFAREHLTFVRAAHGRARKCLVLDCDDTLWGGVVGEVGAAGVRISPEYPGSPYHELQQEVLSLHERGVILALCSRNDAESVWEVFRTRPEMLLREEHISAARINWNDKPTNLREIAAELNIGLDGLVFVDDSAFEIGMVRELLPEVATLHLPAEAAVDARERLAAGGWFDSLSRSAEDRMRGRLYAAESRRRRLRDGEATLEGYLASLEMQVRVAPVDAGALARAAQLTQRTNQFNLTTRRYAESDVAAFADAGAALGVHLADRFGDYGQVGLALLRCDGEVAEIDSFLMSCRVIGRGVEDALLRACLDFARSRAVRRVVGRYRPSAKNGLVADFYAKRGFEPAERSDFETAGRSDQESVFVFDLGRPFPDAPGHWKSIEIRLPEARA